MNDHVNPRHAGTREYQDLLEKIDGDGECPFCVDFCRGEPPKYHPHPIILRSSDGGWIATNNIRPYIGLKLHLLLIPTVHVSRMTELTSRYWVELEEIVKSVENHYRLPYFSFFIRSGDTNGTCGSVTHLHAQIIFGGKRKERSEPILVPLGYKTP